MYPVWIFRHLEHEGPGYLAEVLAREHVPYRLVCIDRGDSVMRDLEAASGLVFMGGDMSVNDPRPWIADELALIRAAAARGMPVLGHCLGGQLIAKALGGQVMRNPVKEIGWLPVEVSAEIAAREWFPAWPARAEVYHWHGETFSLPPTAQLLLSSADCVHQAFAVDNMLALQCHIEMTVDMVCEWAVRGAAEIMQPSATVQSAAQMVERLDARVAALQQLADSVYRQWIKRVRDYAADNMAYGP